MCIFLTTVCEQETRLGIRLNQKRPYFIRFRVALNIVLKGMIFIAPTCIQSNEIYAIKYALSTYLNNDVNHKNKGS